jgi:putative endonuclease
MKRSWIYILCSAQNGTLYIGVTSNLARRIYEHRQGLVPGFTKLHNLTTLIYIEEHPTISHAIAREKILKKWNRAWKIKLIEDYNSDWKDISHLFLEGLL